VQPNDTVAKELVQSLSPQTPTPPAAEPVLPEPQGEELLVPPAPPSAESTTTARPATAAEPLTALNPGAWTAGRDDGSTFSLSLKDDGTFTWDYSGNGQTNSLAGKYSVANDLLVLEPGDGGAMVGRLTKAGEDGFHFQLVGGPPDDPGLTFEKNDAD
jgi:hypothetical protein